MPGFHVVDVNTIYDRCCYDKVAVTLSVCSFSCTGLVQPMALFFQHQLQQPGD